MCLLSFFPPGVQPDSEELSCGASCNPHGFGYAIVIPGEEEILIGKGMDAATLIAEFVKMRAQYPDGPALFHSRYTTHGVTGVDNCHPFVVNGDKRTVVGHNGILPARSPLGVSCHPDGEYKTFVEDQVVWRKDAKSGYMTKVVTGVKEVRRWIETDDRSDTRILADDILAQQFRRLDRNKTRKSLERWLGGGNKLVILTTNHFYQRRAYIFNEDLGEWTGRAWSSTWHSNSGYMGNVGYRASSLSGSRAWWDEDWYSETIPGAGSWYRSGKEGWSAVESRADAEGDNDDPSVWPTTLGGTRGADLSADLRSIPDCTDCGMCNSIAGVIVDIGLCVECQQCDMCGLYVTDCECFFKPRPHTIAFRDLKAALNFGSRAAVVAAYDHYVKTCETLDRANSGYGSEEWQQRREKEARRLMTPAIAATAAFSDAEPTEAIELAPADQADSDAVDSALEAWADAFAGTVDETV